MLQNFYLNNVYRLSHIIYRIGKDTIKTTNYAILSAHKNTLKRIFMFVGPGSSIKALFEIEKKINDSSMFLEIKSINVLLNNILC